MSDGYQSTGGPLVGRLSTASRIVPGATDYEVLENKPKIEGVTLEGDKTFRQLGLDTLSVQDIEKILYL